MKRSLTFATLLLFSALGLRLAGIMEPELSAARAHAPAQPPATAQTPAKPPAQPPAQVSVQASTPLPPGYAGSDTCVMCHTDQEASLKASKHGQAANPRSPAA